MRLTSIFFRNARTPQNENKVPFKTTMPLELKNRVSSKNQRLMERGCLQESFLLLTCLEENEYDDKRCIPQFKVLDQCYKNYSKNIHHAQTQHAQTEPVPNSKNLTHKQITYLLRKYPTV